MKFETKLNKLGINENEVKSIISNCFCGEINGAYFIELNKLRRWEIMETIGNYLDTDKLDFDVRFKTFLKTYEIEENEVTELYAEAFNEGAEDIAYILESNPDVILVLTDDERYHNSFVAGDKTAGNKKPQLKTHKRNGGNKLNLKIWHTEKIENIVISAIKQMPENATNIRLIEGYRHKVGAFGSHHCWTEVEAVYKDDDGHEVGRVPTIDKIGGWEYSDTANYVLYHMGLYKPYSAENLKSLKQQYEGDLNRDAIFPINEIYSNEYLMDLKVKEAIFTTADVDLTFKLDYDSDIWGTKWTKPCDYRIILNGFETEPLSEHDAYFLFVNTFDKLLDNGVKINVEFDMKPEHKNRLSHWRWRDEINF